jgi:hypothetical protein
MILLPLITLLLAFAVALAAFLQAWYKHGEVRRARPLVGIARVSRSTSGSLHLTLRNCGPAAAVEVRVLVEGFGANQDSLCADALAAGGETQIVVAGAFGQSIALVLDYFDIDWRRFESRREFLLIGDGFQLLKTSEPRADSPRLLGWRAHLRTNHDEQGQAPS